jgi:hypothetical protein
VEDDLGPSSERAHELADTCEADAVDVAADSPTGEGPEPCVAALDAEARLANTLRSVPQAAERGIQADIAGDDAALDAAIDEVATIRAQAVAIEDEWSTEVAACEAWPER